MLLPGCGLCVLVDLSCHFPCSVYQNKLNNNVIDIDGMFNTQCLRYTQRYTVNPWNCRGGTFGPPYVYAP